MSNDPIYQFVDRSGIIKSTFMMKIKDDGGAAGATITIKAEANVSTDNGETYKIESDEITTTDVYELVENPRASLEDFRAFSTYDKQPIDETTQFVEMCNPTLFTTLFKRQLRFEVVAQRIVNRIIL